MREFGVGGEINSLQGRKTVELDPDRLIALTKLEFQMHLESWRPLPETKNACEGLGAGGIENVTPEKSIGAALQREIAGGGGIGAPRGLPIETFQHDPVALRLELKLRRQRDTFPHGFAGDGPVYR